MHLAASCGYLSCVKTLLEFGADITLRNAIGQTPLEEAEASDLRGSGECVVHLRTIWRRLEEEAAARMMAMLETEEATAERASGGKKAKKKSKKGKRKATKSAAAVTAPTTPRGSSANSKEEVADSVASGDSSADEDERENGKPNEDTNEVEARSEQLEDGTPVAAQAAASGVAPSSGVWTTVGRKHKVAAPPTSVAEPRVTPVRREKPQQRDAEGPAKSERRVSAKGESNTRSSPASGWWCFMCVAHPVLILFADPVPTC